MKDVADYQAATAMVRQSAMSEDESVQLIAKLSEEMENRARHP